MSTLRVNLLEPYSGADVTIDADLTVTGTTTIGALSLTDLTVTGNSALGNGATDVTTVTGKLTGPSSILSLGTDASGTNAAATDVTQTAPLSTGDATPAALVWQVGVQGSPGTDPQTLTEGFRVQEVANASGREVAAWNPSGSVMGGLPLTIPTNLLEAGDGGRFANRLKVIRANDGVAGTQYQGYKARGSLGALSAVLSGDSMLTFAGWGYDGGAWVQGGQVRFAAHENWSPGNNGARLQFYVNPVGSATNAQVFFVAIPSANIAELVSGQSTLRLIPGATQFAIRDSGNTADVFTVNAAGTAITAPLATSFVVGTDPGGSALLRVGGNIATVGAVLATSTLSRNVSTGSFTLSGGNGATNGGNVVGYGGSHPTQANDIEFRSGANVRGWWDDSAALWEFSNAASTLTRFSTPAAGETSLWLYDADNATLERVTVGAADSGGVGYKVLRIPN